MDTKFMNSGNSKTSDYHRLLLNLSGKIDLKQSDKYVALSNFSIYYTWANIKESYKSNKFKISASTWNEKLELPDESYSVSDIQDYFEHIIRKHEILFEIFLIRVYVNKMENMIKSRIKTGYYLKPLKP